LEEDSVLDFDLKGRDLTSCAKTLFFDSVLKGRGFPAAPLRAAKLTQLYSMLKNSDFGWRSVSTLR